MSRLLSRNLLLASVCLMAISARAQLLYVTNADHISATITGYTNSVPGNLIIPTNIDGLTVTAIGENAFVEANNLTNVTIPSTVTTIEEGAFNAAGLTSVTIPYGATNIGEAAFEDCRSLTSAIIPESITYIGQGAFSDTGLTSVTVPASVTTLGGDAFASCDLTNLVIAFGISSLESYLFAACTLPSVIIPSSVTNITDDAFEGCSAMLRNVFFEGNAPFVDNTAFLNNNYNGGNGVGTNYYAATAYYLPGTTGWSRFSSNTILTPIDDVQASRRIYLFRRLCGTPTIQATGTNFGIRNGQYGFDITAKTNLPVAIEACDDLSQSNWVILKRLTLTNGLFHFSEPFQSNSPARFYRIGFP